MVTIFVIALKEWWEQAEGRTPPWDKETWADWELTSDKSWENNSKSAAAGIYTQKTIFGLLPCMKTMWGSLPTAGVNFCSALLYQQFNTYLKIELPRLCILYDSSCKPSSTGAFSRRIDSNRCLSRPSVQHQCISTPQIHWKYTRSSTKSVSLQRIISTRQCWKKYR